MSRNKTVKRLLTTTAMASVQKIEKIQQALFKVPAKLITELHKEIKNHRKKEVKLKSAINKLRAELNKSESRVRTASDKVDTSVGKKKFKKAKTSHNKFIKIHSELNKDLQKNSDSLESLETNQAKLVALHKHLNQFEKDWAKNAKKLINDAQAKPKQEKKVKIKSATPSSEQPQVETTATSVDKIGFEEASEMVS